MKVVYIAGRFTGKNAWEIENNVRAAETVALEVAKLGAMPLCPNTNTRFFHGTCTDEFWYEGTLELLRRCDAVMLVSGWESSKGVARELEEAKRMRLPIFDSLSKIAGWISPVTPDTKRVFRCVVGGVRFEKEFDLRRTLGDIVEEVLRESGHVGPSSEFEIRTEGGALLHRIIHFGEVDLPDRIFFISPMAGFLG